MRVIELWTSVPMRFGSGGNTMPTHLREVLPTGNPLPWLHETARHPQLCRSLSMEAGPLGVVVSIEEVDGSVSRFLVRDVATARLASSEPVADRTAPEKAKAPPAATSKPRATPAQLAALAKARAASKAKKGKL